MRRRPVGEREAGVSVAIEIIAFAAAVMLIVAVIFYAGRVAVANLAVGNAASEAARTASLSRTASAARAATISAVQDALDGEGVRCQNRQVALDASAFATPVGTAAQIEVDVTCTVSNADLAAFNVPGQITITRSATSPLDRYRTRG